MLDVGYLMVNIQHPIFVMGLPNTNKASRFFDLIKRSLRGESHEYTQGSIRIAIVLLAIPMILELSLESVFAVVDMFFVGKLGSHAIQTVGLTESVISLVYTI